MSANRSLDSPGLLPFLPFVYLAWSDGELLESEVSSIRAEMAATGLGDDLRLAFDGWLNPSDPPSPDELSTVLDLIRGRTAKVDGAASLDIEAFAESLAVTGRQENELTGAERDAVRLLGRQLGLEGAEPTRVITGSSRPGVTDAEPSDPPPLDVDALSAVRDGVRSEIRQRVRTLLTHDDFAHEFGLGMADYRARILTQTRRLADEGIGRLGFPAEHGGTGTQSDFLGAFSVLAHHDLSLLTKFGVQFGLFGGAIFRLGTEHHHASLLGPMVSMELPGCFAMSETDHGSNVAALETTAVFDTATDEFVIDTPHTGARKDYIGNAAQDGRVAVVFAQLVSGERTYGVHAFVVTIRDSAGRVASGVTIEDDGPKAGLNGVDNGRIEFSQVRIPRTALLDRFASVDKDGNYSSPIPSEGKRFFTTIGTLVGGRIGVGTASISAAETALAIAIRYGLQRRQFGPEGAEETVLLDYRQHQRRLMPLLASTYAYRFALEHLVDDYTEERIESRLLEGHAAGLKAWASWHANDTIDECRQACGGAGFLAENRLGPLKADADIFQTYEGDNTVLAQLVARGLLSNYAQQFNDLGLLGTVRFLASRAVETVREANPIVVGGADESELRDPERYLDLLRWREEHLVASLAGRLRERIKGGMDSAVAFGEVQDHAIEAARAHVAHLVVQRFIAVIETMTPESESSENSDGADIPETPKSPEVKAMQLLCDLHALSVLEADRGWFMEHGKLSAAASKSLRTVVTDLCAEVRLQARPLVDAFAIPDEILGATALIGEERS